MTSKTKLYRPAAAGIAAAIALAWAQAGEARVTRVIIDEPASTLCIGRNNAGTCILFDERYEQLTGRAFGELDPRDSHNRLITDIDLAPRNANHKVEYIASFVIRRPKDMDAASGLMWHDVPNRGGDVAFPADSRAGNDVQLLSGWQGDNAGGTAVPANVGCLPPYTGTCAAPVFQNHYVKLPVLAGVTGRIFARIVNRAGTNAPLNVQNNPLPYFPANSADNSDATLKVHTKETVDGVVTEGETIPNGDWKFCYGGNATFTAPGTATPSLPVRICLDGTKRIFSEFKLYQVVFTAKNPYVLGMGTAAFRDVGSFFKYGSAADGNPLAGKIRWEIVRGSSQSGNFTRHFIHLGMNQDEAGRIVHEGAWPLIAGRRVANNSRWGQPDGVLELFQMGSEGPQWWHDWPDRVRDLPTRGILDRCRETHTCPKIVETFGGAEVFALKMTTSWVGTDPKKDIPLPRNVRRYYLPSSTHGGGNGAMNENPPANGTVLPDRTVVSVNCPGNNFGRGSLRANPVPATQMVNRMRVALRDWVMTGKEPPPSQWPTLKPIDQNGSGDDRDDDEDDDHGGKGHDGDKGRHGKFQPLLVEPTMQAMGFPRGVPGIPDSIFLPENFIFPVFDYDWGPDYDHSEASGVPTNAPPFIRHVIKMLVPRVDADGNELGGLPTVLRDAPLGTYLGWNITAGPGDPAYANQPFHAGQVCDYVGGMVPFAKTKAQRLASGDPRLSLEERYGTHDGYVAAVRAAADNAACRDYLNAGPDAAKMGAKCAKPSLPPGVADDWVQGVTQAMASNVCNQPGDEGKCNPAAP
jgi:alpha/beta hydrolase family protein